MNFSFGDDALDQDALRYRMHAFLSTPKNVKVRYFIITWHLRVMVSKDNADKQ